MEGSYQRAPTWRYGSVGTLKSGGQAGIRPIPAEPLPLACFGLLAQVKSYELLTVEAAVRGDRIAAYQALLTHPLGPSADKVQTVLDDMLTAHEAYLPQFQR